MLTREQKIHQTEIFIVETLADAYVKNLMKIRDRIFYSDPISANELQYKIYSDKSLKQAFEDTYLSRRRIYGKMYRLDFESDITDEAIENLRSKNVIRKIQYPDNALIRLPNPIDPKILWDNPFQEYLHEQIRLEKNFVASDSTSTKI